MGREWERVGEIGGERGGERGEEMYSSQFLAVLVLLLLVSVLLFLFFRVAYERAKEDVSKWLPIVKKNREAPVLDLTPENRVPGLSTAALAAKFLPSNEMEREIHEILKENGEGEEAQLAEEELELNKVLPIVLCTVCCVLYEVCNALYTACLIMTVEEMKERQNSTRVLYTVLPYSTPHLRSMCTLFLAP